MYSGRRFFSLALLFILFLPKKLFCFERKIIKIKKIKLKGVFGLTINSKSLYASALTKKTLVKINLFSYNRLYLYNFNLGWSKNYQSQKYFESIHSVDFNNKKMLLTFYHTNKVIIYNIENKNLLDIGNINKNKVIDGPSYSFFDKKKKLICICEYHGNISFYDLHGKFLFDLKEKLKNLHVLKPHMIKIINNFYHIVDTKQKKIILLDQAFNFVSEINNNNIKSDFSELHDVKFSIPVSITNYKNKYLFITDTASGLIVLNKDNNIIANLSKNRLIINGKKFTLNTEIKRPYDSAINNLDLYLANTHGGNIILISNFIKILDSNF